MRKSIAWIALAAICLFALGGCEKGKGYAASSDVEPVSSSLPVSDVQPDASSEVVTESPDMSVSDARNLLAETIDTDTYMILDGSTKVEVDGEGYYVFLVAQKSDNTAVGQVAVNKRTGEKFNYAGENKLTDYSDFQLYDPATDAIVDWEGTFSDGTRTLELIPMDERSFEYMLDDQNGVARGMGNTATDEENNITFTYADGASTLSGAAEGVFKRTE